MLIWYARSGMNKDGIREIAAKWYSLPLLEKIRPTYTFDVTSDGTMPVALSAFFESNSFEDAIRNAISVGGDSDTIAAITGSIAEAYYGVPEDLWHSAESYLTEELRHDIEAFYALAGKINENRKD